MRNPSSKPRVVDLFAGAGLFSSAFAAEGFRLVRAIEKNPVAARTYRMNLGDHITVADLGSVVPEGPCDVIIAGPPCQGFSTLGKRDEQDPRNLLTMHVATWVEALSPRVVVVENVPAFLTSRHWASLHGKLEGLGYEVTTVVLNSADCGLPQIRQRCFAIASRIGLPSLKTPRRRPPRTVREAWDGLPATPDGANWHIATVPSLVALARMKVIPAGGDKRDIMRLAPDLAPPSWWRTANQATDVWGRMLWDEPSNTLRTCLLNASKGRYIHPDQHRVITLREAARLHTIADDWQFAGTPYQVARQIGNGVPPLLGRLVAGAVRRLL